MTYKATHYMRSCSLPTIANHMFSKFFFHFLCFWFYSVLAVKPILVFSESKLFTAAMDIVCLIEYSKSLY